MLSPQKRRQVKADQKFDTLFSKQQKLEFDVFQSPAVVKEIENLNDHKMVGLQTTGTRQIKTDALACLSQYYCSDY